MRSFISSWDRSLFDTVTITPYEDIDPREPVPAGLHLFTDFERLLAPERAVVRRLHDRLLQHPESYSTLNSPAAWLPRLGLNQALSDAGLNDYRAFRLTKLPGDLRFPAFVRWANDHGGSLGDPVTSRAEIAEQVRSQVSRRRRLMRRHLLVVEQLDVRSPDGLFRKYSAQKISDQLIPRHLFFGQHWVTKFSDVVTAPMVDEEQDFLETFPHRDALDEVFRLAGLEYGRIDYGFHNGRLQVWEINTNPVVAKHKKRLEPERLPGQEKSVAAMTAQFRSLAAGAPTGPAQRVLGPLEAARWRATFAATKPYEDARR